MKLLQYECVEEFFALLKSRNLEPNGKDFIFKQSNLTFDFHLRGKDKTPAIVFTQGNVARYDKFEFIIADDWQAAFFSTEDVRATMDIDDEILKHTLFKKHPDIHACIVSLVNKLVPQHAK